MAITIAYNEGTVTAEKYAPSGEIADDFPRIRIDVVIDEYTMAPGGSDRFFFWLNPDQAEAWGWRLLELAREKCPALPWAARTPK